MASFISDQWMIVNDDVMGGCSTARVIDGPEALRFEGQVSLENNGGFASARGPLERPPTGATGIAITVRGDGRQFQLRLRAGQQYDGIAWRHFLTTTGKWHTLQLKLADFEPVFRGRRVRDAGAIDASLIGQLGFMIADQKAGPFWMEVKALAFVTDRNRGGH